MARQVKTATFNMGRVGSSPKGARGSVNLKVKPGPTPKAFIRGFAKLVRTHGVGKNFDVALMMRAKKDRETSLMRPKFMVSSKAKLAPIQHAMRATRQAQKSDDQGHHAAAQEYWHKMVKAEKDPLYRAHYKAMAKHHFDRSYGKDSKIPYHIGEARHRDRIPGGKSDKRKPSDFCPRELQMGITVEREHTKSNTIATEIAMDHLAEDPRYYSKLKRVHKEGDSLFGDLTEAWAALRESKPQRRKRRRPRDMEEFGAQGPASSKVGLGDPGNSPPTIGFPSS